MRMSRAACRSTLDRSLLMGLNLLCDHGVGFFNCTRETLMNDSMTLLPKERVVLEILETITPDPEVMEACVRLKTAGYRVALDDFIAHDPRRVMVPLADMLKVDWMATTPQQCRDLIQEYSRPDLMFLAEKIETPDDLKSPWTSASITSRATSSRNPLFCKPAKSRPCRFMR